MDHLVYAHIYLTETTDLDAARAAWLEQFRDGGPALAVLGIARTPGDTPVEINAVAVTDIARKKQVRLPGTPESAPPEAIIAGDRLFFSDCSAAADSGAVPADAETEAQGTLTRMGRVLAAAAIGFDNVVFVNPYLTAGMSPDVMNRVYAKHFKFGDTPARATIHVNRLQEGANLTFTGVAARDLASRRAVRPKTCRRVHREPVRLRERHALLLGEGGFHSRTERRRVFFHRRDPGSPECPQPLGWA